MDLRSAVQPLCISKRKICAKKNTKQRRKALGKMCVWENSAGWGQKNRTGSQMLHSCCFSQCHQRAAQKLPGLILDKSAEVNSTLSDWAEVTVLQQCKFRSPTRPQSAAQMVATFLRTIKRYSMCCLSSSICLGIHVSDLQKLRVLRSRVNTVYK